MTIIQTTITPINPGKKTHQLRTMEPMNLSFKKLTEPDPEIARTLNAWANDPDLAPLIRPHRDRAELEKRISITTNSLAELLEQHPYFLIYADGQLVGEMNYQVDPEHLFKKETGTAWIGIVIGDPAARGKGVGTRAMQHLEGQIRRQGLKRIELGVFEFNTRAYKLYLKLGYREIGRIDAFTYWQGKMWQDIRLEKYLKRK